MALPQTRWTLVRAAVAGDPQAARAFTNCYRPVVVSFLERRGLQPNDAEDVAQEVFLRLFHQETLARALPEHGRMRSLVLAVARHSLGAFHERRTAKKRGGGAHIVPVSPELSAQGDDELFDREWFARLIAICLTV